MKIAAVNLEVARVVCSCKRTEKNNNYASNCEAYCLLEYSLTHGSSPGSPPALEPPRQQLRKLFLLYIVLL